MPEGRFTLLYDGDCPFCRREVEWLRRRDREPEPEKVSGTVIDVAESVL
jgi:predicted DCC family thiol-disulfide oxidoreductase YuxK